MRNGTAARLAGENRHGDLAWLLGPDGTITDSRIWDPYGQSAGSTGTTSPSLGYQGDYTDPESGNVWMGARWYQPNTGTFTNRDSVFGMLRTPISLNRYTYANADPLEYFDPDGHWPKFVDNAVKKVKQAAGDAWDATGGRAVTAVNDHVVQPVVRSTTATVQAVKSTTATLTRTVGRATRSSAQFVRRNAKTIVRTTAVIAAAGATYAGCTAATWGVGAVGCASVAGAVGGMVNGAFDCPGRSAAQCARGVAIQGAAGGVAGAAFGAVGAAGIGGAFTRTVAGGFAGGFTHSATSQGLTTGRINLGSAFTEGLYGAATAGALHGAGIAVRGVRGTRAPAATETATAETGGARFVVDSGGTATDLGPRVTPGRPVVIGEGMQGRVIPEAERMGADWYQPPELDVPAQQMAHNRYWINEQMNQGRGIIDVGPAPGRAGFPEPTSPFYGMERNQIMERDYPYYAQQNAL